MSRFRKVAAQRVAGKTRSKIGQVTGRRCERVAFAALGEVLERVAFLATIPQISPEMVAHKVSKQFGSLFATWAGCPSHPSQRPHEYMARLLPLMEQAKVPLERMCDLYARERWAHPASSEHPQATGEWREVPALWVQLRPRL